MQKKGKVKFIVYAKLNRRKSQVVSSLEYLVNLNTSVIQLFLGESTIVSHLKKKYTEYILVMQDTPRYPSNRKWCLFLFFFNLS